MAIRLSLIVFDSLDDLTSIQSQLSTICIERNHFELPDFAILTISIPHLADHHCFKMNAFWASVNFDAFIVFHSSQPGKLQRKTQAQNDPVMRGQSSKTHEPLCVQVFTADFAVEDFDKRIVGWFAELKRLA
jgi:hypothetical protein